jgi:phosphate:Na+ symporter
MHLEHVELLGRILAGLGLFFVGIRLLSANMLQFASLRLRQLIGRATSRPVLASLLGVAGGFLMQKPSGVIAILASMQAGGLISLRQAMPIIAWCNIGLALLAFYVVIPIGVFVSYTIGVTGLLLMFSKKKQRVALVTAVFGAALLFYGLEEMKAGTGALRSYGWFQATVGYANASPMVALLVGAFTAAVTQSFIAIAIMAVGLVGAGALGAPQAMMIIYGANFGVGCFRRLMTASLTGESQQLFLYQNFFRYVGTAGSVLLFYVPVSGIPVMLYLARLVTPAVDTQLALIFLACNLPAVLAGSLFQERFARLIERKSPKTAEDDLGRLKFLAAADPEDREDALNRLAGEVAARVRNLSRYLDTARAGSDSSLTPEVIHRAGDVIYDQIAAFEQEFMKRPLTPDEAARLSMILNHQALVRILDDALFHMACLFRDRVAKAPGNLRAKADPLLEAMDTFVPSLADAMASGDARDAALLLAMTGDKGALMDEVRHRYLANPAGAQPADQAVILELTNSFEHATWIIHRLANLLAQGGCREPGGLKGTGCFLI